MYKWLNVMNYYEIRNLLQVSVNKRYKEKDNS